MQFRNLAELADKSVARFAERPLFGERHDGSWRWQTYRQWYRHVDWVRGGLAALGVKPGDRIAIVSRNSAAWATVAYASYGLGAAVVPMYEAQRPSDWELILHDCEATVVFGRTPQLVGALRAMQSKLPALRHIIQIEGDGPDTLTSLEHHGRIHPAQPHAIDPEAVAGFIYTSGTTGTPKGVMLSHRNLTTNVEATLAAFPLAATDRTLSFLPWAHVYGQVCELHILIAAGGSTAFNTDTTQLLGDLREVRPTILVSVPRVFTTLHGTVREQLARKPRVIQRVFDRGLAASIRHRRGERLGIVDTVMRLVATLLFARVRKQLGGHLRYALSGGATLSRDVADFIDGMGIAVYEGYGLSETAAMVSLNRPGKRKLGTVGVPIEGVRLELDTSFGSGGGEGELIVHGPNVMIGYHGRPAENAQVFTADGGLRTGDLARIDAEGFVSITGRIKEQYKLENGKYVMPGPLEDKLALSPLIKNVMLHGAGHAYNVALVAVDMSYVRRWATEQGIDLADVARDHRLRALVQAELDRLSKDVPGYERPRDCLITEQPFTIENGLLTPTLKLRRKNVLAIYGDALEELYTRPRRHKPIGTPEAPVAAT